ncbi:MAG: tRNA (guanosine(37)-N1)-methyltransferase TrmD [Pseudomonadota bacterium]
MTTPPKSHGRLSIRASAGPRALLEEPTRRPGAWAARVVTLFPEAFPGVLGLSLTGRALAQGLWTLDTYPFRDFATGKHRNVDDTPAGGGAGMVLRADVVDRALRAAAGPGPVVYLSPRGRRFDQATAQTLADGPGVTLLCGRFEGVDERVLEAHDVWEISLGDYVLTGGEIAAQALIDACVRLIPRVLGNAESAAEESFAAGLLEHPQYTRPTEWDGRKIPEILLSGHHGQIAAWRRAQAEALTKERRPDLWRAYRQGGMDPKDGTEHSGADISAAKAGTKDRAHEPD